MKTYEDAITDIQQNPSLETKLDDNICIGCDHCGDCCINVQVRITPFDIYNMRKHMEDKRIASMLDFYFGDTSHLPLIIIKNNKEMCPLLKISDGDFKCSLGDDKPLVCDNNFIAIVNQYEKSELHFVPLGEKVDEVDIDSFVDNQINNSKFYFMSDENDNCCAKKYKMKLRDYISRRLDCDKENAISSLMMAISLKYFDAERIFKILRLTEGIYGKSMEDNAIFAMFYKIIFHEIYFYADPKKPESFYKQTVEHIRHLEKVFFPKLRILYGAMLKVMESDDKFLKMLDDKEDWETKQKRFNEHYYKHRDAISNNISLYGDKIIQELKGVLK